MVYVTLSVRTHMQTFSAFSSSIYDFFCHLNSRFLAKAYLARLSNNGSFDN